MNANQTRDQLAKIIDDGSSAEAADFTASMILDKCVVEFRADLPEVFEDGAIFLVDGSVRYARMTATERRKEALRNLAIAEYLDAREAREAEAAKKAELTARRDALAAELVEKAYGYHHPGEYASQTAMMQVAIDRIIEAEDKIAAIEAQA